MNLACFQGCRLRISGPGQPLQKYLWKKGRKGWGGHSKRSEPSGPKHGGQNAQESVKQLDRGGIVGNKNGKVENVKTRLKVSSRFLRAWATLRVLHKGVMWWHADFLKIIETAMYRMHKRETKKFGGYEISQWVKKRHEPGHLTLTRSSREHLHKTGRRVKWQEWWLTAHRSKGQKGKLLELETMRQQGCCSQDLGDGRGKRGRWSWLFSYWTYRWPGGACVTLVVMQLGVPEGAQDWGPEQRARSDSDWHRGTCLSTILLVLSLPQFAHWTR